MSKRGLLVHYPRREFQPKSAILSSILSFSSTLPWIGKRKGCRKKEKFNRYFFHVIQINWSTLEIFVQ